MALSRVRNSAQRDPAKYRKLVEESVGKAKDIYDLLEVFKLVFTMHLNRNRLDEAEKLSGQLLEFYNELKGMSDPVKVFEYLHHITRIDDFVWEYAGIDSGKKISLYAEMLTPLRGEGKKDFGTLKFEGFKTAGHEALKEIQPSFEKIGMIDKEVKGLNEHISDIAEGISEEKDKAVREAKEKYGIKALEKESRDISAACRQEMSSIDYYDPKRFERGDYYQQKHKEKVAQVRRLTKKHLQPIFLKFDEQLVAETEEMNERLSLLAEKKADLARTAFKKATETILKNAPTQEEADKWVSKQTISDAAKRRLKKIGYRLNHLKRDMAEFYRLTGGRLGRCSIVTKRYRRARASNDTGEVFLDSHFGKKTLFHEMGHLLEADPGLYHTGKAFLANRLGPEKRIKKLSKITGNSRYQSKEVAYEDGFFSPYVGKVYNHNATEVWSMGAQMLSSPEDLATLAVKDPEMLEMIVGGAVTPMSKPVKMARDKIAQINEEAGKKADAAKTFYAALDRAAKKPFYTGYWHVEEYRRHGRKRPTYIAQLYDSSGSGEKIGFGFDFTAKVKVMRFVYLMQVAEKMGVFDEWMDRGRLNSVANSVSNNSPISFLPEDFNDLPKLEA